MVKYKNKRNPVLPLEYHIPDSEGHVMPDGKLYVYGSYDDREDVFCSEKYYVASTSDMEHWTIHDESVNGKIYHGLMIRTHRNIRELTGLIRRPLYRRCWLRLRLAAMI